MSDTPDRLSAELEAFLAPERRVPDPPAQMQTDTLARVAGTLGGMLGWPGGSGPGGGGGGGGSGGSNPPGGPPPGGHLGGGSLAAHGAKHLATGSLARTVATLVVGGVLGSGVHAAYDQVSARRAERARVAVVAPPAPSPAAPPPAPAPAPAPTVPAGVPAGSPTPRVEHVVRNERGEIREHDRNLAAERALIEQARSALARDQGAAALAALERHAHDYPQGELEEERESLQVQALVGLERYDQARKIGARFHKRFPRSIFGAGVDEALKSIP
jgi:hypothetical protein